MSCNSAHRRQKIDRKLNNNKNSNCCNICNKLCIFIASFGERKIGTSTLYDISMIYV